MYLLPETGISCFAKDRNFFCDLLSDSSESYGAMQVGILSRVLEEVDKIVQEFKDTLYKAMENPNVENSQASMSPTSGFCGGTTDT